MKKTIPIFYRTISLLIICSFVAAPVSAHNQTSVTFVKNQPLNNISAQISNVGKFKGFLHQHPYSSATFFTLALGIGSLLAYQYYTNIWTAPLNEQDDKGINKEINCAVISRNDDSNDEDTKENIPNIIPEKKSNKQSIVEQEFSPLGWKNNELYAKATLLSERVKQLIEHKIKIDNQTYASIEKDLLYTIIKITLSNIKTEQFRLQQIGNGNVAPESLQVSNKGLVKGFLNDHTLEKLLRSYITLITDPHASNEKIHLEINIDEKIGKNLKTIRFLQDPETGKLTFSLELRGNRQQKLQYANDLLKDKLVNLSSGRQLHDQKTVGKKKMIIHVDETDDESESTRTIEGRINDILLASFDPKYVTPEKTQNVSEEAKSQILAGWRSTDKKTYQSTYSNAQRLIKQSIEKKLLDKDELESTRQALLREICDIGMFYYFCSTQQRQTEDGKIKECAFREGTFHVTDPLFGKLLTCYLDLIAASGLELGDPKAKHWFASNKYAYWRASTHTKNLPQSFGIDIKPSRTGFTENILGKFEHILGYVNPGTGETWFKFERKGCQVKDTPQHLWHAVESKFWRLGAKVGVTESEDDSSYNNKEHVPVDIKDEFNKLFPGKKDYAQESINAMYQAAVSWLLTNRASLNSENFNKCLAFIKKLEADFDQLYLRVGNEIIITPEKIEHTLLFFDKETNAIYRQLQRVTHLAGLFSKGQYKETIKVIDPNNPLGEYEVIDVEGEEHNDTNQKNQAVKLLDRELDKLYTLCQKHKDISCIKNLITHIETLQKKDSQARWEYARKILGKQPRYFTPISITLLLKEENGVYPTDERAAFHSKIKKIFENFLTNAEKELANIVKKDGIKLLKQITKAPSQDTIKKEVGVSIANQFIEAAGDTLGFIGCFCITQLRYVWPGSTEDKEIKNRLTSLKGTLYNYCLAIKKDAKRFKDDGARINRLKESYAKLENLWQKTFKIINKEMKQNGYPLSIQSSKLSQLQDKFIKDTVNPTLEKAIAHYRTIGKSIISRDQTKKKEVNDLIQTIEKNISTLRESNDKLPRPGLIFFPSEADYKKQFFYENSGMGYGVLFRLFPTELNEETTAKGVDMSVCSLYELYKKV
ncbi:MAG: hypothetical protein JW725_02350 [Candidatus Babeliaceae bacterium]|nr:hypothetical protein [Candidatus Babeliaceae bacterium]